MDDKLERMRHSAAHVMAQAVQSMFPGARFGIGPTIADGFYYDFDLPRPLTPEDLEALEKKMKELIAADLPFERWEADKEEAEGLFADQPYKLELIRELDEDRVSLYRQGDFTDLCRGPHVDSTGQIGAFKLLSVAGAYWRGDEHRPQLQRIYGTAFETGEELEAHLLKLEEASRRDHRRLGRELDLFSLNDEVGAGLVLWHPKGALVRTLIEDFWRQEHRRRGYELVYSPHIAKADLWDTSGHLEWFRDSMYPAMDVEGQEYLLKPMNCPFHILMYKTKVRSYRELPIRWGELGTVYRYERSGVLHGVLRPRGFTQDDAHIFCRPDQLQDEIVGVVEFADFMLRSFGYQEYEVELSLRDPQDKAKYVGDDDVWELAENTLRQSLKQLDLDYRVMEGEAKFYGPAIDIKMKDALGRGWQGPTIQVDFNEPERFDVTYVGQDGHQHRPVMIHRTVLGSMERFMAGLVEHYAGAFPLWLAPVQAVIIPIADRHLDYAYQVAAELKDAELRVEVDDRGERMNQKIRDAQLQKVPYMLVVGDKEAAAGTVSVRSREQGDLGPRSLADLIAEAQERIRTKG